jgi:pilus assembly protein CpaF
METLFLLAGFDVPHRVVRRQIASGVDLIIQLSRERDGRRVVSEITEVTGMEGDTILMSKLAIFDDEGLKSTGVTSTKMDRLHVDGGLPRDFFN